MKNLTTLLALAAVASGGVTIARAQDTAEDVLTQTVRFADLDTASAQGAAMLFTRTKHAAENVCRALEPDRALAFMHPYATCVHVALSEAIATINRPAVTAYAAGRGVFPIEYTVKIARGN